MSTPDQPETPRLTRRQLRELRDTASNPIITPEASAAAAAEAAATPIVAPLPRAAEPIVVADEPPADDEVDLDTPARTRRSARQQERLRTASVPVIDGATVALEHDDRDDDEASDDVHEGEVEPAETDVVDAELVDAEAVDDEFAVSDAVDVEAIDAEASGAVQADVDAMDAVGPIDAVPADHEAPDAASEAIDAEGIIDSVPLESTSTAEAQDAPVAETETETEAGAAPEVEAVADITPIEDDAALDDDADDVDAEEARAEFAPKPVVAPTFGSGLLAGEGVELELPASFDQLLSRGSTATGSLAASNALILSQTPETGSFSSPVTATGEVLVTGTFSLPESFGSTGTSAGSSDGKDIDAILIDGELPAASSPTPIAASAAISTIKSADDIIKPPAPEKGSRLMLALVITAGALALALTGVLIVALLTGAFQ